MSIPTDGHSSTAAAMDAALRACAAASLAAPAPALLMRLDGSLIAANPAGQAVLGKLAGDDRRGRGARD